MRPSLLSKDYESLHYEVEQFGIKIILIEPDVVKSLFFDNLKMATNAQGSDSPYLDDAKNKCRICFFIRKCYSYLKSS
jgi:short-subunit dehydrogenase